jgi:hypothetical protein
MPEAKIKEFIIDRKSPEAQGRHFVGHLVPKSADLANRTIKGLASTIKIDRDGEIILPSAMADDRERFLSSHAPFLSKHNRSNFSTPHTSQIGWVMDLKIERYQVPAVFRFSKTPVAEEWWTLASDPEGKGIAFSIGFIPLRAVTGSVADLVKEFPQIRESVRAAGLKDDDGLRLYTKIEILEISGVEVNSNRESLQLAHGGRDGQDAPEAKAFTESISKAVLTALEPRLKAMEEQLRTANCELRTLIVEQIDEFKSLVPDQGLFSRERCLPAGAPDEPEDPAASGSAGKAKESAAASLLATCEK